MPLIPDVKVETLPISALTPYARNPRTHTKKQVRQIADSIKAFGWTNPILIDGSGGVIAGHGRIAAAKLLGIDRVPIIRRHDMTEAQVRAYVIADNRLAELAGWDTELLAIELQGLSEIELNFSIEVTGFKTAEIDNLIIGLDESNEPEAADEVPEIDETTSPVTAPGDLWLLGRHRLLCADATRADSYARLMEGMTAQMVFTDPPYNVPIQGHVCGLGAVKHAEFAMAAGEMSEAEFTAFLETVLGHLAVHSADGATREEKQRIGRPSSPRWEIDVVAYKAGTNELLALECKSYLDSQGVRVQDFVTGGTYEKRYKLFNDDVLRETVLERLRLQMIEAGSCAPDVVPKLGLIYGRAYSKDSDALSDLFRARGWVLFDDAWLRTQLQQLADGGYENQVSAVVSKLLLRAPVAARA